MILIIGGAGQGKLEYVLQKTGLGPEQVARDPETARSRPVFAGVEQWPELEENELLAANPEIILICDEVGSGVVPADPEQRLRREQGGTGCAAAWRARAERVERIFCGLSMVLKGEGTWN